MGFWSSRSSGVLRKLASFTAEDVDPLGDLGPPSSSPIRTSVWPFWKGLLARRSPTLPPCTGVWKYESSSHHVEITRRCVETFITRSFYVHVVRVIWKTWEHYEKLYSVLLFTFVSYVSYIIKWISAHKWATIPYYFQRPHCIRYMEHF